MPDRALLVYDGDCAYCRRWIRRYQRLNVAGVDCVAYQQSPGLFAEVPPDAFRRAVHLRDADGRWTKGAEAAFRAIRTVPGLGILDRLYRGFPPFASLSETVYRWVERNRNWLPI